MIEGLPTVALGVFVFRLLPETPADAKWLTKAERAKLLEAVAAERQAEGPVKATRTRDALRDIRVWILGGIDFCILLSVYAMAFWMPTLFRDAGVRSPADIGLLTACTGGAAMIGMTVMAWSSDRHRERRRHLAGALFVGAIAMIAVSLGSSHPAGILIAFCFASAGVMGAVPVFFSIPPTFLSGAAAAAGFALACSLANLAGLVSNVLAGLALDVTGSIASALATFAGMLCVGALLALRLPPSVVNH